jgi:hypothetical protein
MHGYWVYRGIVKTIFNGHVASIGYAKDMPYWRQFTHGRAPAMA